MDKRERLTLLHGSLAYRILVFIFMAWIILYSNDYPAYQLIDTYFVLFSVASFGIIIAYYQVHRNPSIVQRIAQLETVFVLIIYFISGGIFSPMIWMVLNPVTFYIFWFYNQKYIILHLTMFILASCLGPYLINRSLDMSVMNYFGNYLMVITLYIAIILLARQYDLHRQAIIDLEVYRKNLNESIQKNKHFNYWLSNSYQLVNALMQEEDNEKGIYRILGFAAISIPVYGIYIYYEQEGEKNCFYSFPQLEEEIKQDSFYVEEIRINGHIKFLGYLGLVMKKEMPKFPEEEKQNVELIANIVALYFERNYLLEKNKKLLIVNEQRRIAGEIHDSVNQDLHGTSYMLYNLIQSEEKLSKDEIIEKIKFIYKILKDTGSKLKNTIYELSNKKRVKKWEERLLSQLERMKEEYSVDLSFQVIKNQFLRSSMDQRQLISLIRIVIEATTNAIKHGEATHIAVSMRFDPDTIYLEIQDNGHGFIMNHELNYGLGIENMERISKAYHGQFEISSDVDMGTTIKAMMKVVDYES
ncbi:MAG: hypothetical protein K9L62_04875 [Vallitaleaceae bacterium]|nr:hypothetical protein [Vallitaleaceae bacterium]